MRKGIRKLSLNRETLVSLSDVSTKEAHGGTLHACSAWSNCYCTNYSACCSGACGTQECF